MQIVYLNLATDEEPFQSHMKAQKGTWASNLQSTAIWIYGSYLSEAKYSEEANRLDLPVREAFENILEKSVLGIEWAVNNLEFDYIVRGNTSNYYDDQTLRVFLSNLADHEYFVGSELGSAEQNRTTKVNAGQYLSGTGIILSRNAARKVLDLDLTLYTDWPDDVAISHHLSNHGLQFTRIQRGDITDFKPLMFTTQYRVKSWTNHEHTSERMWTVDKILKKHFFEAFAVFLQFNLIEYQRYSRYFPIRRGLNGLRHVRQAIWISESILKFPVLKLKHSHMRNRQGQNK